MRTKKERWNIKKFKNHTRYTWRTRYNEYFRCNAASFEEAMRLRDAWLARLES
jgi:hypothetical protein